MHRQSCTSNANNAQGQEACWIENCCPPLTQSLIASEYCAGKVQSDMQLRESKAKLAEWLGLTEYLNGGAGKTGYNMMGKQVLSEISYKGVIVESQSAINFKKPRKRPYHAARKSSIVS